MKTSTVLILGACAAYFLWTPSAALGIALVSMWAMLIEAIEGINISVNVIPVGELPELPEELADVRD